MKTYIIEPTKKEVEEINLNQGMQLIYTLLGSILVDDNYLINDHVIYSDVQKTYSIDEAYMIGNELFFGKSVLCGSKDGVDAPASINSDELEALISYEISDFYRDVLSQLKRDSLNIKETFMITHNNQSIPLNYEWVLYTFNIADNATKDYFLNGLKSENDHKGYFQKMADLAFKAGNK